MSRDSAALDDKTSNTTNVASSTSVNMTPISASQPSTTVSSSAPSSSFVVAADDVKLGSNRLNVISKIFMISFADFNIRGKKIDFRNLVIKMRVSKRALLKGYCDRLKGFLTNPNDIKDKDLTKVGLSELESYCSLLMESVKILLNLGLDIKK